jgi:histidinol-phosphate aminotransferase
MRAAGNPYAISSASLTLAEARLSSGEGIDGYVGKVRDEVKRASALLTKLGANVLPSQANFVLARVRDAVWLRDALAGLGIAVRIFPGRSELEGCVRITMPGDEESFARLEAALSAALKPEAIIFDIDDTLADVSGSYRKAVVATAESFGVSVTYDDIVQAKAEGDANNDWELTRRLMSNRGVDATLEEVTERFEGFYQGDGDTSGFKFTESLTMTVDELRELAKRYPLGIVTGRPRTDAMEFLEREGIADLFDAVITMDDGPLKPDSWPVRTALSKLGVTRAWMVGDTPDDMVAARGAGVVPIGVVAPGEDPEFAREMLTESGAARVLMKLNEIEEVLS